MTHSTLTHAQWRILRNHEGRYSVYPATRPAPDGWDVVGEPGTREACLETIAARWTDMRPDALKEAMS
ncbi:MbtH protein [Sulfitobacter marinus]|uniref:MbtH protein n=1 Tax=Sulfitobacter marinus TaxID=394264 RepID=A0A1I6UC01_9RHOB|nr:MbtH family NRPS accessory protein [Sulfitobacter marinus]SFS98931.1 MbtH protein [Sulfitobacter marinus]